MMDKIFGKHLCTVEVPGAKMHQDHSLHRITRFIRRITTISFKHPECIEYFKNTTGIIKEHNRHVIEHPCSIHPFSIFRVYYQMYMVVIYIVVLILYHINLNVFLSETYLDAEISGLQFFLFVVLVIDITLTFFTGYPKLETKSIILRRKKIALNYLLSIYFPVDILMTVPFDSIVYRIYPNEPYKKHLVEVLRSIRIIRLFTVNQYIKKSLLYFGHETSRTFRLTQYVITTLIIVNWFAYFHIVISTVRILHNYNLMHTSWLYLTKFVDNTNRKIRFMEAFFRSSGSFLNLDRGLYELVNSEEIILVIIAYIFGKIWVMCLLVLSMNLILSKRSLYTKYNEVSNQLNEYMRYKNFPIEMRKRVEMYYDYKFQKKFFRESLINIILSEGLRKQINVQMCRKLVGNVSLFSYMNDKTVSEILQYLHSEVYLPNDVIVKAGDPGDHMYFIETGTVAVYTPSGREVCHLEDGAYFGEISLLMKNQMRSAHVIAIEICEIYSLARMHFKKYFANDPDLYRMLFKKAEDRFDVIMTIEEFHKNQKPL